MTSSQANLRKFGQPSSTAALLAALMSASLATLFFASGAYATTSNQITHRPARSSVKVEAQTVELRARAPASGSAAPEVLVSTADSASAMVQVTETGSPRSDSKKRTGKWRDPQSLSGGFGTLVGGDFVSSSVRATKRAENIINEMNQVEQAEQVGFGVNGAKSTGRWGAGGRLTDRPTFGAKLQSQRERASEELSAKKGAAKWQSAMLYPKSGEQGEPLARQQTKNREATHDDNSESSLEESDKPAAAGKSSPEVAGDEEEEQQQQQQTDSADQEEPGASPRKGPEASEGDDETSRSKGQGESEQGSPEEGCKRPSSHGKQGEELEQRGHVNDVPTYDSISWNDEQHEEVHEEHEKEPEAEHKEEKKEPSKPEKKKTKKMTEKLESPAASTSTTKKPEKLEVAKKEDKKEESGASKATNKQAPAEQPATTKAPQVIQMVVNKHESAKGEPPKQVSKHKHGHIELHAHKHYEQHQHINLNAHNHHQPQPHHEAHPEQLQQLQPHLQHEEAHQEEHPELEAHLGEEIDDDNDDDVHEILEPEIHTGHYDAFKFQPHAAGKFPQHYHHGHPHQHHRQLGHKPIVIEDHSALDEFRMEPRVYMKEDIISNPHGLGLTPIGHTNYLGAYSSQVIRHSDKDQRTT